MGSNNDFDVKFRESKHIRFYPFVGEKYSGTSPKILILGESHYGDEEVNQDSYFTRVVMDKWLDSKCFRYTAAMITGKDYYGSDDVWEKLCFYNFFQRVIGGSAREKAHIDKALIEDSRKAYLEAVKILEPDLVIAWGVGRLLNEWIPQGGCEFLKESQEWDCSWEKSKKYGRRVYRYVDKSIAPAVVWHITHPSSGGFSYNDYHEKFKSCFSDLGFDYERWNSK